MPVIRIKTSDLREGDVLVEPDGRDIQFGSGWKAEVVSTQPKLGVLFVGHEFVYYGPDATVLVRRDLEMPPERVETTVWEPNPEKPGYLRLVRRKTLGEVYGELRAILGEYPDGGEEYFGICGLYGGDELWPPGTIVVFAVEGDSEGHYIHVHVAVDGWETQKYIMIGKTFAGADAAWKFARRLSDMLDAG